MSLTDDFLHAYDEQLRTDVETRDALAVSHLGPLRLAKFTGGRGFITYARPEAAAAAQLPRLVASALEHFRQDAHITEVEWKTRGHDHVPGLYEALAAIGFEPDEPESIMVGPAELLAVDVTLPPGVHLRRVTEPGDVAAMAAMQGSVFGDDDAHDMAKSMLRQLARGDDTELWIAEADGHIVSAGRLEPVPSSEFAGIWGGATVEPWRGRGIYRALTAARARSALSAGKKLINSDSTEYSRPILERAGLVKISTTTPYRWTRSNPDRQATRP